MQWLVLVWAVFALTIYIGGFLSPHAIGVYTPQSGIGYALFLIAAISSSVARWLTARRCVSGADAGQTPSL